MTQKNQQDWIHWLEFIYWIFLLNSKNEQENKKLVQIYLAEVFILLLFAGHVKSFQYFIILPIVLNSLDPLTASTLDIEFSYKILGISKNPSAGAIL